MGHVYIGVFMVKIHPSAIIDKKAQLSEDVEVGPYTIIGPGVKIGSGSRIGAHCLIEGLTILGRNNRIFTGTVIGSPPQDLKYKGEKSQIIIGDNNTLREYITINPGTSEGTSTKIGNNNLLMAYTHIAHNCLISDGVIIANAGTLAGHVTIEDRAIIGGLVAVHQFVRIGRLSIVGGCSKVVKDIPPYALADGHPAKIYSLNVVGLRRAGLSAEVRTELKKAFKTLFHSGLSVSHGLEKIKEEIKPSPEISHLCQFVENSQRGLSQGAS